ncbi:hypothetical protein [Ahniella affigens]|uniref:hypothetical protein n=1 Tax=Ahniella affigens TaxID=2021234 RepID=UPI0011B27A63|nr:hypothetical protein [Ahniella affigens]
MLRDRRMEGHPQSSCLRVSPITLLTELMTYRTIRNALVTVAVLLLGVVVLLSVLAGPDLDDIASEPAQNKSASSCSTSETSSDRAGVTTAPTRCTAARIRSPRCNLATSA